MAKRPYPKVKSLGFTLIELVVVISIIGVLAIVASARLENLPSTRAQYAIQKMRSDLRYSQILALASQTRTRVVFNAVTDTYRLERESSPGSWVSVVDPASRGDYMMNYGTDPDYSGVDISTTALDGNNVIIFDSVGAPFNASNSPLSEPAYIELNGTYRVNIKAQTGNLEVTP